MINDNSNEVNVKDNSIQKILLEVSIESSLSEEERIEKLKNIFEMGKNKNFEDEICMIIANLDDLTLLFENIISYASESGKNNLLSYVLSKYPIIDVSFQNNYCFKNSHTPLNCLIILAKHETFKIDLECFHKAKNISEELLKIVLYNQHVENDLDPFIASLRKAYEKNDFISVYEELFIK